VATATPTPTAIPHVNLALNQPVMASSYQDSTHYGARAVDGNISTQWQTQKVKGKNKSTSEWIEVDLGSIQDVDQVILNWDAYFATNFSIDVSNNGNNWTTIITTANGDGGIDTLSFNPVQARYIRLTSTAWSSSSYRVWLNEFEVFAVDTPSMSSPTPTSTSVAPSATPLPTATTTPTPTPDPSNSIHVGDLDNVSNRNGNRWNANVTVLVHDSAEAPLQGVIITGNWGNGISGVGNCTTGLDGICNISQNNLKNNISSVTFSITDLSSGLPYRASINHDPDGDSDGTTIVIIKP
jgi:hypothetical protein